MYTRFRKMFRRHAVVHSVGGLAAAVLAVHMLALLSPAEGQKRGQPLTKIRYAVPSPSMSFTPVFLAAEKKLFEAEGLDVTVRIIRGVGSANALIAGSVDFAQTAGTSLVRANLRGQPLIGLASPMNRIGMEFVVDKKQLRAAKLTKASPLKDRMAFLRGKTVGFLRLGGIAHMYALYVFAKAGLAPQKDVTLVALGKGMAMVLALQRKEIDAFVFPPPFSVIPEVRGFGKRLISGPENDIPELVPFVYTVVSTMRGYYEKHPDLCRKMVKAHIRGARFIRDFPVEALTFLKKRYKKMNPKILERSWEIYSQAFDTNLRIDRRGLEIVQDLQLQTGVIKKTLDVATVYTNEFFAKP